MNTKAVSSSSRKLVGKCLCGAVQASIADEFLYAGYCHCRSSASSETSPNSRLAPSPFTRGMGTYATPTPPDVLIMRPPAWTV
jgi:hypothetical protein